MLSFLEIYFFAYFLLLKIDLNKCTLTLRSLQMLLIFITIILVLITVTVLCIMKKIPNKLTRLMLTPLLDVFE